ncbi:ERMES complex subunit [Cladochytrium tenue]|nr:ERMES complex subunit [Cladochytrium tenue]
MSFKVNWPKFSQDFLAKAREQLTKALNKGTKPASMVDHISVVELNMGTKPPDLEILDIGDLAEERFRGIFRMVYNGDAYVVLHTKVQANPLNEPKYEFTINKRRSGMLAANKPLVVPMQLRISDLKLRGIIVLVVDRAKGITLVFKNDPLEKVDVSSTFDNVPSIRRFLQNQIEGQLRSMFQEELPQLIHNLSLEFIQKKEPSSDPPSATSSTSGDEHRVHGAGADEAAAALPEDIVDEFVNRPYHQKWSGNEPVMLDENQEEDDSRLTGSVLHRSLAPKPPSPLPGLPHVFDPELGFDFDAKILPRVMLWTQQPQYQRYSPSSASESSDEPLAMRIIEATPRRSVETDGLTRDPPPSIPSSSSHAGSLLDPSFLANPDELRPQTAVKLGRSPVPDAQDSGVPSNPYLPASGVKGQGTTNPTPTTPSRLFRIPSFASDAGMEDFTSVYTAQSATPAIRANRSGANLARPFSPVGSPNMTRTDSNGRIYHHQPHPPPQLHAPRSYSHSVPERDRRANRATQLTERVVLQPTDNEVAAHLATLMQAHHTMAPLTHHLEHATFRTLPHTHSNSSAYFSWTGSGSAHTVASGGGGAADSSVADSRRLRSRPMSDGGLSENGTDDACTEPPTHTTVLIGGSAMSRSMSAGVISTIGSPPSTPTPLFGASPASPPPGSAPPGLAVLPSPQQHRRARVGSRTVHTLRLPPAVLGTVASGLSILGGGAATPVPVGEPGGRKRPAAARRVGSAQPQSVSSTSSGKPRQGGATAADVTAPDAAPSSSASAATPALPQRAKKTSPGAGPGASSAATAPPLSPGGLLALGLGGSATAVSHAPAAVVTGLGLVNVGGLGGAAVGPASTTTTNAPTVVAAASEGGARRAAAAAAAGASDATRRASGGHAFASGVHELDPAAAAVEVGPVKGSGPAPAAAGARLMSAQGVV